MKKHSTGFTLIELTLAMTFISVLLLAIVMTAIQAGRTYNKGIVLQSVNQSGTHISDTLRRDFLQADARRIAPGTTGVVISLKNGGAERGGRFCLGDYSYVWNTPEVVNKLPADMKGITTIQTPTGPGEPINFVRVTDPGASLCVPNGVGAYPTQLNSANVTHMLKPKATKATGASEVVLAIHQMTVAPAVQQTNPDGTVSRDSIYAVSFVLGTSETGEINTANQSCKPPNDTAANDEFCAINKFEMIARTNG